MLYTFHLVTVHLVDLTFLNPNKTPSFARRLSKKYLKVNDIQQSGGVYPSRIIVARLTRVVRGWGYALASYSPDHTAP